MGFFHFHFLLTHGSSFISRCKSPISASRKLTLSFEEPRKIVEPNAKRRKSEKTTSFFTVEGDIQMKDFEESALLKSILNEKSGGKSVGNSRR